MKVWSHLGNIDWLAVVILCDTAFVLSSLVNKRVETRNLIAWWHLVATFCQVLDNFITCPSVFFGVFFDSLEDGDLHNHEEHRAAKKFRMGKPLCHSARTCRAFTMLNQRLMHGHLAYVCQAILWIQWRMLLKGWRPTGPPLLCGCVTALVRRWGTCYRLPLAHFKHKYRHLMQPIHQDLCGLRARYCTVDWHCTET